MHARTGRLRGFRSFLLLFLAALTAVEAQPAFQVKDLNTTTSDGVDENLLYGDASFVALGDTVFFRASDGIHGVELWKTDGTEAGTRLAADVCPGVCSSAPADLTAVGGSVFFLAHDLTPWGPALQELWKSDGTQAGTVLVKDLFPGAVFGGAEILGEVNGLLLFAVAAAEDRRELWRSDGTPAGTFLLAEVETQSSNAPFERLARLDGKLFLGIRDVDHGREIWATDGSVAGTGLLKDVAPGPADGVYGAAVVAGGRVLFFANGPEGAELWASDGTPAGTALVKDIMPGPEPSFPQDLTVLNGEAFFFATPDTHLHPLDRKLFRSDGTAAGTVPVGSVASNSHGLTAAGGRLYFLVNCGLWTSDATAAGTLLVQDFTYASGSGPQCGSPLLNEGGDELLFSAEDGVHGRELWKSDGTPAGTSLVADVHPGPVSSFTSLSFLHDGLWYFRARGTDFYGLQLWVTDGSAPGTRMLRRINSQASGLKPDARGRLAGPRAFFDLDGTLLFQGNDGSTGTELWRSDGTAAGTSLVKDLWPGSGSSVPGELTRAGGTVFFRTGAGSGVEQLWKTDGTPAGTQNLWTSNHLHNFGYFSPRELTAVGDRLLFGASQLDDYESLTKSDGTPQGTRIVFTSQYPPPVFTIGSIISLGDRALFHGSDLTSSPLKERDELWVSDGTEAGTAYLGVDLPFWSWSIGGPQPEGSTAVRDGVLLFAGWTPEHGEELWRSDGTPAGTFLVTEIVAGPGSQPLGPFATAGPAVFFAVGGDELWKNDAGGTSLVRALPGNPPIGIRSLTTLGGKVYFSYDDGAHGRELWVSDGTAAGTRMVEDVFPGPGSSHPRELHVEGGVLVFTAFDGIHGVEPWRSDGTALGTRMLEDIAPGALPSSPTEFTASGPNLYFGANDGTTGFELWALPRTALLSTFADVPASFWAWSFIEMLAATGITRGCAPDRYCPAQPVTRAESTLFLLRGLHRGDHVPPPGTGTRFEDVPASHWAVDWIEQFASAGFTNGCAPNRFCPASNLSRAELAVFLLRARHGAGYVPPPATGTVFEDVPANHWVGSWIEQLAREGITNGCAPNRYCPGQAVTRAEMAVFLVRTFGLTAP